MRSTAWALSLVATACASTPSGPTAAPSSQSRAIDAPVSRFAEPSLAPPAFTDPARRAKLASAFPAVERYLEAEYKKLGWPGLTFGIVIDGELAFAKSYGVRDREANALADADSVFRIASLTKSFTAMAILMLRDEGRLQLDDPAVRHVPELAELRYPTRDAAAITIRDLLTHGAGFPEDNPWGDRQLAMSDEAFSALLKTGLSFSSSPGTQFEYSNLGFAILGRVVSRVARMPYRAFVTERILRPLAMHATVFDEREVPAARLARGYHQYKGGKLEPVTNLPDGAFGPMGGLYTSLRDLARYAAFQLSAWPPRDDRETGPLRRSSVREMQQSARHDYISLWPGGISERPPGAGSWGYGYGLGASETCELDRIVSHGGGLPGYGSTLHLLPEHGVGIVVMANVTYAAAGRLAQQAVRILDGSGGLAPRAIVPAPSLIAARDAVARLLDRWSDADANAAFADSFFLDVPRAAFQAELETLRAAHGKCRLEGAIDVENALRGTWKLACDKGWVEASLTLAPARPAGIQFLALEGNFAPSARAMDAANQIAALTTSWNDATAARLFDPSFDRAEARRRIEAMAAARGACRVQRAVGGDGAQKARVQLTCDRFPVIVTLSVSERSGQVNDLSFQPVPFRSGKCAR